MDSVDIKYRYLEFKKLIRDKNIDTIIASGGNGEFEILSNEKKIQLLKEKLVEESNEVLVAKTQCEIIEEIGDVVDVLNELMKMLKIKNRYIRKSQRKKAKQRGKFKKGVYCHYVRFPVGVHEKWMDKYKDITDDMDK